MKSIVYSMNGKKILIKSSLTVTKYLEAMLIENCVKRLTIIPNNFSRISQLQKGQWKFIKNKINSNKQSEKNAKLKEGHNLISDEKSIANCLNNCFARLGLYKGKIIAPKLPSFNFKGNEFNFRPVTRRELYKFIDKLPTQNSAGPGYIPSWALKDCKLSIGTHLQFAINECINANLFPEILKEAMSLTSIKKETGITLKTIDQYWSLQRYQKFLKDFSWSKCRHI